MIDRYRKGRRIYTHWDKKTEQVTIVSKDKKLSAEEISIEVPQSLLSKQANFFAIHNKKEEFVIDFGFLFPNSDRVKILSRVIMSPKQAKAFMLKIKKQLNN